MKSLICRNGHARTPDNIYRKSNGTRGCVACQRAGVVRWRQRHTEYKHVKNARRREIAAPRIEAGRAGVCECCGAGFLRLNRGHNRRYCGDVCKATVFNTGDARRWRWLWTRYRVTKVQFETMCAAQGNACAICRIEFAGVARDKTAPQLDHCHSSMSPRGILCRLCNTALGNFKDDPTLVRRALDYLSERSGKDAAA